MKTLNFFGRISTRGLICMILLSAGSLPAFSQYVLSQDELIDQGTTAYNSNDFVDASIYLFAYMQLNPVELSGDRVYADLVANACANAFTNLSNYTKPGPLAGFTAGHLDFGVIYQRAIDAVQQRDYGTACVYYYAFLERSANNGQVDPKYTTYYNDIRARLQQAVNRLGSDDVKGDDVRYQSAKIVMKAPLPKPHHRTLYKLPAAAYQASAVAPAATTNPFSDAFEVAFNAASTNFAGLKADAIAANNFRTTLTVGAPITAETNIFYRNNRWAFRFNITGASTDEASYFQLFSVVVEQTLSNHHFKYSRTNLASNSGDVSLPSIQYNSSENFIQLTRMISGNTFYDEVIIYHLGSSL